VQPKEARTFEGNQCKDAENLKVASSVWN